MPAQSRLLLPIVSLCLASLLVVPHARAQEGSRTREQQLEIDRLQMGIEEFFRRFSDAAIGPEQALRTLVGSGPLKTKGDDLTKLLAQAGKLEDKYGRYLGNDLASVKTVGSDLVILRFLHKAERFPVVWHFYYYRSATNGMMQREWNLIEIRFDTNLDVLDR